MNPLTMALLLVVGWGAFAYSARRRWKLMMVGRAEDRSDQPGLRLRLTMKYAFAQLRMRRYKMAGLAHLIIFVGFLVLLLRTLMLWGRGFYEPFDFWIFGTDNLLGQVYAFLKDVFAVLVFLATLVFVYFRAVKRLARMTLSVEGMIILVIILVMMVADVMYDGAAIALEARGSEVVATRLAPIRLEQRGGRPTIPEAKKQRYVREPDSPLGQVPVSGNLVFTPYEPAASVAAMMIQGISDGALTCLKHAGFWAHAAL
ncbi:MAG: (Fe-S)-binding protein, partial [Planctomycetota bacterium]